jgi:DNA-binding PadR family transcriptional regulator
MHPYEISQTLRSRGKEQSIKLNYGSLYSVVESLAKRGLIEAQETVREGRRPERTVYAITPAGGAEFEDWLAELLSTPVKDFTSLEAGLSLMPALPPAEVARLLEQRAERLLLTVASAEASCSLAAEHGLPELFLIEDRYRIAMLTAEARFVNDLARDIRSGAFPGTKVWRRMHELRDEGISLAEILADPVAHLGEEARALKQPPS